MPFMNSRQLIYEPHSISILRARPFNIVVSYTLHSCTTYDIRITFPRSTQTEYGRGRCLLQFWFAKEFYIWHTGKHETPLILQMGMFWGQYVSCPIAQMDTNRIVILVRNIVGADAITVMGCIGEIEQEQQEKKS